MAKSKFRDPVLAGPGGLACFRRSAGGLETADVLLRACRPIRWLPYAGLAYCGLVVPLLLVALGLVWWELLIGIGLFALGGDWLLPDPFTYVLSPRKRRAVKLAIEYVEAGEGPWPIYGMVGVVGSEPSRTIVSVAIKSGTRPPFRRFLAVADATASVEELDFEYVSTNHRVHGWR